MTTISETLLYAWRSRRVWWFTASARTRARFARTVLGSFWLGFSNLLSVAVLAAVYGTVFNVPDFREYVVYLGGGLVTWNSMAGAISSAPNLFEHNVTHLKNTNLNPIFYSLEEWAFHVQTFVQSLALVIVAMSFFQPSVIVNFLVSGWLPLVNFCLFLLWIPLVICLLGARYRDLYQLVPIALQLVFLLSPILYQRKNLGALGWIADLNPLYRILSPVRDSLLHGTIQPAASLIALASNLVGIVLAMQLLNRERSSLPFLF